MNIMYDYEKVFQVLSVKFKENPEFHIEEKNADFLLRSAIENDDIELIKLLVKYHVLFTEDIFDFIGCSSEFVFFEIMNSIEINQPDFNWSNINTMLFDLAESSVATSKMFLFAMSKQYTRLEILYKGDVPLLILLCMNNKFGILNDLLDNNFISKDSLNILKYNNLTFLEYLDRYSPYNIYISFLRFFNLT